jgi:hypothetical protein
LERWINTEEKVIFFNERTLSSTPPPNLEMNANIKESKRHDFTFFTILQLYKIQALLNHRDNACSCFSNAWTYQLLRGCCICICAMYIHYNNTFKTYDNNSFNDINNSPVGRVQWSTSDHWRWNKRSWVRSPGRVSGVRNFYIAMLLVSELSMHCYCEIVEN